MFFGLHARSKIFNNDNNICIKKLVPRLFFFVFKRSMPIFQVNTIAGTQAFNMAEIILPNCANSTKDALKFLKLRLKTNFPRKDWKRAAVAYPYYSYIIINFVLAIYRDSSCRGQRLRLFEIGFVTFWALYWAFFFLKQRRTLSKEEVDYLYCLKIGIDRFQLYSFKN